jgi:hypothetical protein
MYSPRAENNRLGPQFGRLCRPATDASLCHEAISGNFAIEQIRWLELLSIRDLPSLLVMFTSK